MTNRRVIIALKGLGAMANHGVYDFERARDQRFSADIVMWVETAGATDDIAATVSYADIADEAMAVLTGKPVDLIETLAETIASRVMSHEGVVGTEVTVHKPDAPIDHPFADVSVTVRAGETDSMPLSLSLKGIYEAEDGSVLTGEIEAYGRAQAPSPAPAGGAVSRGRRHARRRRDPPRPPRRLRHVAPGGPHFRRFAGRSDRGAAHMAAGRLGQKGGTTLKRAARPGVGARGRDDLGITGPLARAWTRPSPMDAVARARPQTLARPRHRRPTVVP